MKLYYNENNIRLHIEDNVRFMQRMQDDTLDLTVTSPPYDNLKVYEGFKWDCATLARELFRVTKKGGIVVWVVGDSIKNGSESLSSFRQALKFRKAGFCLHDTMIYAKNGFSNPSVNRYHQVF